MATVLLLGVWCSGNAIAEVSVGKVLAVSDEIETARFKVDEKKQSVFVSPDGLELCPRW